MFSLQVGWQSLVVLYEHDESLTRLQELLRLPQVFTIQRDQTSSEVIKFLLCFDTSGVAMLYPSLLE